MSEQINLGIDKLLKGNFPAYEFQETKNSVIVQDSDLKSIEIVSEVSKVEHDSLEGRNTPENSNEFIFGKPNLEESANVQEEHKEHISTDIQSLPLSKLEIAYQGEDWETLASLAEQELNSSSPSYLAKSYWSFAALKLKTLRADLIAFGIVSIWQDELPNLSEYQQVELTKILIPVTELARNQTAEIDSNLSQKLSGLLPVKIVIEPEITSPPVIISTEVTSEATELTNLELDNFQKYLNSLTARTDIEQEEVASEPIQKNVKPRETDFISEEPEEESKSKSKTTMIVLLLLFLVLLGTSFYFYRPKETPISLISDSKITLQSGERLNKKSELIIESPEKPKVNPDSPLSKIINELDTPEEASSDSVSATESKPDIDRIAEPQELDLDGPVEPKELSDILDGHAPADIPKKVEEEEKSDQGNNVMDEYLRDGPIVDERVSKGKFKKPAFQTYRVTVVRQTSLYSQPNRLEAELMMLYFGDRLLVVEDLGDWLKVDAFGRVFGYVEKNSVR